MKSSTKYYIDNQKITQIFENAGLGAVSNIESLEAGEFNSAYFDIWDGNIFYQKQNGNIEIALIDTERGFWGGLHRRFCKHRNA